jgi:hypothetical protein
MYWNLLSCKNIYKKHINLSDIKVLFSEISSLCEIKMIKNPNAMNYYSSMFTSFKSFEDFAEKNIISLGDLKSFMVNGSISWNEIMLNSQKFDCDENLNDNWRIYISSLNFLNDLISISEVLKYCNQDNRDNMLKEFIRYINHKLLPARGYIPFAFPDDLSSDEYDVSSKAFIIQIFDQHAFCLSTKERVPFHILIEIAHPFAELQSPKERINRYDSSSEGDIDSNSFFNKIFDEMDDKSDSSSQIHNKKESAINETNFSLVKIATPDPDNNTNNNSKYSFFSNLLCCFNPRKYVARPEDTLNTPTPLPTHSPDKLSLFGTQKFSQVSDTLLLKSEYNKSFHNRKVVSLIVKGGDDMRQDQFVSQVIEIFKCIFDKENLDIFLQPLNVISTGRGGIIQTLTNTTSVAKIKSTDFSKVISTNTSCTNDNYNPHLNEDNLKKYYVYKFGDPEKEKYKKAISNFVKSLAGYSLLCYFLEIKDRNNGNILIDDLGHMIHIDFGYLLAHSPGNMNFEKAPFKLTMDFIELMNGIESGLYDGFQDLFFEGFLALRKNFALVLSFLEIYILTNSDLPCFYNKETVIENLKRKFLLELDRNTRPQEDVIREYTNGLIVYSLDNWRTKMYDKFQKFCVGVN